MIRYIIPLLDSFLVMDWVNFWFFPFLALAFLSSVPRIIMSFFRR